MPHLGVHKLHNDAKLPYQATDQSACFDVHSFLLYDHEEFDKVIVYNLLNELHYKEVELGDYIRIYPGERVLVPTGLILDISQGYSVRIHPRSGLSLKQGLTLANCEGVIDSDYIDPLFIMLTNTSNKPAVVNCGERIAQLELVEQLQTSIYEEKLPPRQRTNREGGFGSTGN